MPVAASAFMSRPSTEPDHALSTTERRARVAFLARRMNRLLRRAEASSPEGWQPLACAMRHKLETVQVRDRSLRHPILRRSPTLQRGFVDALHAAEQACRVFERRLEVLRARGADRSPGRTGSAG